MTNHLFIAVISLLPIIVFLLPMLLSGKNTLFEGDFDMQVQMTEAARISIIEFKQFPFWNPWVSGGVPLFADPQFGLITPQTVLSFVFGSVLAWKLTILIYFVIGFFSMRLLLRSLLKDADQIILPTLLAYIWIFGSFFTLRAVGGHFTFLLLTLTPLAIYLLLNITKSIKYPILLSLVVAYCINAALHYSSILMILILGFIAGAQVVVGAYYYFTNKERPYSLKIFAIKYLQPLGLLAAAIVGALVLTSGRVYASLEYLKDNSVDRSVYREGFIGFAEGIKSIFLPYGSYTSSQRLTFGQFEASNYIGTTTGILLIATTVVLAFHLYQRYRNGVTMKHHTNLVIFSLLTLVTFIIGLGGDTFALLRELPVMSSMRVSTRYFFITSLALIAISTILFHRAISLEVFKKHTKIIIVPLVGIAAIQVFTATYQLQNGMWNQNPAIIKLDDTSRTHTTPPRSERLWNSYTKNYHALTQATFANRTQLIADNALVDTRIIPTQRCDEDERRCAFILTQNAKVISWTPNRIAIERTASGPIHLNMNQSSHWKINDQYLFKNQKTVESDAVFIIPSDQTIKYTLSYAPLPTILK
jgi:hypothetical protein